MIYIHYHGMDFKIVNKKSEFLYQEILRRIHRLQSGATIDSLKTVGANTDNQIGASYVSLKQLASQYQPNETLALLLWNTQKREEQIIACFLLPPDINKEKITQLTSQCISFEIASYLGSIYLSKYPDLAEISECWLDSDIPYRQIAILTAIARHLIINKRDSKISKAYFNDVIHRNFKDKYVQLAAERYRFNI